MSVLGPPAWDNDAARWLADPRPDLNADSALWSALLAVAYNEGSNNPHGLFGTLRGLRCLGAELALRVGGLRLLPGEMDSEEYISLRSTHLLPRAAMLTKLLARTAGEGG